MLPLDKLEGADFKHDNGVLKLQSQNTKIWHFWFQIYAFFYREDLRIGNFEGANVKSDYGIFKILA